MVVIPCFPHRRESLKLSHGPLPVIHVLAQESGWLERFSCQRGRRTISGGRFPPLLAPIAHEVARFLQEWSIEEEGTGIVGDVSA